MAAQTVVARPRPRPAPRYPETDGKPMAETDVHRREMANAWQALEAYFAGDPDVYVSSDLLIYYEEGNRRRRVAPDVFVVRDVEKRLRRVYLLWEEGKAPDWLLEVTSRSTRREDIGFKRELYRQLGVREYFLFDPLGEYLQPPLQGYGLQDGAYVSVLPNAAGHLESQALGLELAAQGDRLRFYDPAALVWLLPPTEASAALQAAEAHAAAEAAARRQETAARQAAEAHAAEMAAEVARLRAALARQRRRQDG